MTELKPCPWCKKQDGFPLQYADGLYAVCCENCGCRGPVEGSEEAAENAWNRRSER